MKNFTIFFLASMALITSCSKDDDDDNAPVAPKDEFVFINLNYEVDGQALLFDTIIYTNDAGSQYGVSRMLYYVSQVSLIKPDSSLLQIKNYQYVDARNSGTNQIAVKNVIKGSYIGLRFNIGLDSAQNITNALPLTTENLNMEWPVPMGGGYHFMKFEGHASDSTGNYGFAMHLGLNAYLVQCTVFAPIQVSSGDTNIDLVMNLNEWFRNPEIYDFNVDGNYSMGVMSAMLKLKNNGTDVFTIQ
jgi:hypothetical protein